MKKSSRNIILLVLAAVILSVLIIYAYFSTKIYYNDSAVIGNSAGNLYNGGLFCEYDGVIYFSNRNDDGALYKMDADTCSNIKKVYDDKICYINADSHYLYYSRRNNEKTDGTASIFTFYNTGVYRIKRSGSPQIDMLYNKPSGLVSLFENSVYYQHYDKANGLSFYRVGIDGSKETRILDEAVVPASFYDGRLYFSGVTKEHNIRSIGAAHLDEHTVFEGMCFAPIATAEGLYYISLDDYSICRVSLEGGQPDILVSESCCTYNLSTDGKFLYYQVDRGANNRICELELETMKTTTILEGNYKNIHVTTNYVFFNDFNDTKTYAYATDGSGTLSIFEPPIDK